MRSIIIHYHLFKNAGSTIDDMLMKAFGTEWLSYDGNDPAGRITTCQLTECILRNPLVKAISSHQALLPMPIIENITILPIFFLRHPLDRVRSVYAFERRQGIESGPISKGAEHAARLCFKDYLRWRLDSSENGVVHNFQTLNLNYEQCKSGISHDKYRKAIEQLKNLKVFGLVERFDESIDLFAHFFDSYNHSFNTDFEIMNQTNKREANLNDRLLTMERDLGEATWIEIQERNYWDLLLYDDANDIFTNLINK